MPAQSGGPASLQGEVSVRESVVRERVLDAAGALLRTPEVVALVRQRLTEEHARRASQGNVQLAQRKRRLAEVDGQLANLVESVASGLMSRTITDAITRMETEAESLRADIERDRTLVDRPVRLPSRKTPSSASKTSTSSSAPMSSGAARLYERSSVMGAFICTSRTAPYVAPRDLVSQGRSSSRPLEMHTPPQVTLRGSGTKMVAGAGFEPTTFGL